MNPISVDFIMGVICACVGLYMLIWRLNACNPRKYTPALCSIAVLVGMLAWSTLALVSYSTLLGYPDWLHTAGWKGSWGYTNVRIGLAIFYILSMIHMCKYAPKSKKESVFKI